jgi:hypothetical protein
VKREGSWRASLCGASKILLDWAEKTSVLGVASQAPCPLIATGLRVIKGQQGSKKNKVRNDRIIAVEKDAHSRTDIKTIADTGKQFVRELEGLFVDYHKLSGEQYRVLGLRGAGPSPKTREIGNAVREATTQTLIRFLIGRVVVSVFAVVVDLLKPKSFAPMFG